MTDKFETRDGRRIRAVALPPEYLAEGAKLMAKKRAETSEPLTDAEVVKLERLIKKSPLLPWHFNQHPTFRANEHKKRIFGRAPRRVILCGEDYEGDHCNLYGRGEAVNLTLAAINALPKLLAERKASKAEVERLEHVVRFAGRMLADCNEYKRQGRCKDAMVNVLLRRAREAAEAAGGSSE